MTRLQSNKIKTAPRNVITGQFARRARVAAPQLGAHLNNGSLLMWSFFVENTNTYQLLTCNIVSRVSSASIFFWSSLGYG